MYKDLLIRIKSIQKKNMVISNLRQESFNIFSILRKEYDEENLHSAFLWEMLRSNGSHGMGNIFLKIFVKEILISDFTIDGTTNVYKEKKIEGGRVDIYIKNKNKQVIIIENKIYAGDQKKQLIRYSNHLKNIHVKSLELVYLTLDGIEADEISTKDKNLILEAGKDYQILSYRSDIIKWMNICLKESVEYPTLRETIKQYIFLLKKLTGQLTNNLMENEINLELKKNYKAAKLISDNLWKVQAIEVQSFVDELGKEIKERLSDDWTIHIGDVNKKWNGVDIRHKDWSERAGIRFEGASKIALNGSIYGVYGHNKLYDRMIERI